ncbi:MAG: hypothetical protein ACOYI2_08115 [Bacillota bacterium]
MQFLDKTHSIVIILFVFSYLIDIFFPCQVLELTQFVLSLVLLMINFPFLKHANRYISISLLLVGTIILLYFDAGFDQWLKSINKNAGLVAFLATVPMLGFPLSYEDFQGAIKNKVSKYFNSPHNYYNITAFLTVTLSMLINIACIPIIYHLVKKFKDKYPLSLFSKAVTRGFSTSIIWAPNAVSIAVVLPYLKIPWVKFFPGGLFFLFITIIIIVYFEKIFNKADLKSEDNIEEYIFEGAADENSTYLVKKLSLMGIFILSSVVLFEVFTGHSAVVAVPVVAVFAPLLIALLWKKKNVYYNSLKNYYRITLPSLKSQIVLFMLAGFFGQALDISGAGKYLSDFIYNLNIQQPVILICIFMYMIIILAIIGIHPVISVSTILVTFPVSTLPLMPMQFVLTLTTAYSLGVLLSPISGTVLITAGLTMQNPLNVGVGINWKYAFIATIFYIALLSIFPF